VGSNQTFRQGSRRIYRRSSCYVKVKFQRDWACYPQGEVGLIFAKHGIRELNGRCTKASCFGLFILRPNEAAEKLDFFPASQLGLHSQKAVELRSAGAFAGPGSLGISHQSSRQSTDPMVIYANSLPGEGRGSLIWVDKV
jgi:hypothetical protein